MFHNGCTFSVLTNVGNRAKNSFTEVLLIFHKLIVRVPCVLIPDVKFMKNTRKSFFVLLNSNSTILKLNFGLLILFANLSKISALN